MPRFLDAASLYEPLYRANVRILLWLNGYAVEHPTLYKAALLLTDRGSDLLILATLLLLWFWPRREDSRSVFNEAPLVLQKQNRPWRHYFGSGITYENERSQSLTREQSRAQVLILGGGGLLAYIIARYIAFELDINRPFASYWLVDSPPELTGIFHGLRTFGSFPSDHAAMLACFAVALFFWNHSLAWWWTGMAVLMAIARVAVGFHYPLDMLGGVPLGLLCVGIPLIIYRRQGSLYRWANTLADAFDLRNVPYCYILYFLVGLAALEAAMHFKHLLEMVFSLRYMIRTSLGLGA